MANLVETARWEAGIYQFETSDPVMGGPNGIDNRPTRELANRTLWLKTELAKAVESIGSNKTAADNALALKVDKTTQIMVGNGLIGGGTLESNRMISMGVPSAITASSTNTTTTNSHTHFIDKASTTTTGIVRLNNTLTSDATDQALTAAQGKVLDVSKLNKSDLKYTRRPVNKDLEANLDLCSKQSLINFFGADYISSHGHLETTLYNLAVANIQNMPLPGIYSEAYLSIYLMGAHSYIEVGYLRLNRRFCAGFNFNYETWTLNWIEALGSNRLSDSLTLDDATVPASARAVKLANDANVSKTTTITAGNGLTGGGDLSASRTITLGTPGTITGSSTNSVTATGHTHAISAATTAISGVTRLSTATNSTATNMAATPSAVKAAYDLATDAAPSGMVVFFSRSTPPPGWLKCNGAAVSRTVYASLFAAIGTTAGAGDGSTTFNVPDIRGDAIRGWDDGRGVDAGRALGSEQMDAFQGHARDLRRSQGTAVMHGVNYYQNVSVNDSQFSQAPAGSGTGDSWLTGEYLQHRDYGTPRVAAETRMRNIALLACIKI